MNEINLEIKESNETKKWIMEALLTLLEKKEYQDITIAKIADKAGLGRRTFYRYFQTKDQVMREIAQNLMNEFADTILKNHASNLETVTEAYFEFWEHKIDVLLLLKKAQLLHFIEDNLFALIADVALKVKHIPVDQMTDETITKGFEKYKYDFVFKIAGYWHITLLWCEETPRKTPAQMSKIVSDILLWYPDETQSNND